MSKYSDVPVRLSSPMSRAHICADCSAPDPTWASINRGVLICDECCSVHRSLGRHISQVKSLKKGSWCPTQLSMVQLVATFANNIWEHLLKDPNAAQNKHKHRKPNPRDPTYPTKAEFIRAKYHFLSFMNKQRDSEVSSVDDISKQLHSSVRTTSLETSLRLLSLGADPNYYHSEKGNCPLHIAAQSGQAHQVELLVVYGADPGAFDNNGKTPVDYARKEGHIDLAERLLECQFELTDRLAAFLCNKKPDHRAGQHFIIPEMADNSVDLSELAKAAKKRLQGIPNKLFEDLAMDVYDEVDRRENEAIWLSSQNCSDLSDKQTVPFLPVNPEFTSTRNQGRQKLARFNPREFATLIIDILSEVKRRQQGLSSPQNSTLSKDLGFVDKMAILRKAPSQRSVHKGGSLSDDEPLYDSVASDEDYASIGDTQSLKEEKVDKDSKEAKDVSVASSDHSETPIMLEEYIDLRKALVESQAQVKQLIQTKNDLKQEVILLQNMVQKLLQENQMLRSTQEGTSDSTLGSVTNGFDSSLSGIHSQRGTRPQSMFEPRDPQKHHHWQTLLKEEGHKIDGDIKGKSCPSVRTQALSNHQETNSDETPYDNSNNPGCASETKSSRSSGRSDSSSQVTPTNSSTSIPQDGASATPPFSDSGGCFREVTMPTQQDVVKKTEKITKKIHDLLVQIKDGKFDSFPSCAEKIHSAVLDMAALFPTPLSDKKMQEAVDQLTSGSMKLQEMCNQSPPGDQPDDSHILTDEVINCAYLTAKAAKQLVTMFE